MTSDNKIEVFRDEISSTHATTTRDETIPSGIETQDVIVLGPGLEPRMMNLEVIQAHVKEHGLVDVEEFVKEHGMKITDADVLARIRRRQEERAFMGDSATSNVMELKAPKEFAPEEQAFMPPREKTYDHKLHRGKW